MSTIIDTGKAVRVTNTTEAPYLIKKNTRIADFSVVTPQKSKHIKPVDMVILRMIPEGDPDLNAYLKQILKTNKPKQQNNVSWFPILEDPGKFENHTPIQTRILKEIIELKEIEKLNRQDNTDSQNKFPKQFDWTDTLLTETEN